MTLLVCTHDLINDIQMVGTFYEGPKGHRDSIMVTGDQVV